MKKITFLTLFSIVLGINSHAFAASNVLCANSAGAITAKTKCSKSETRVSLQTLQATALGPQGPKGDPGIINLSKCHVTSDLVCKQTSATTSSCTLNCSVGEFVLQYGAAADDSGTYSSGANLKNFYTNGTTVSVARSVEFRFAFFPNAPTSSVSYGVVCCPIN